MSCRLIDSGTPQDGWKITCSRSCENTGVGVSGLPTITRSVWMIFSVLDDAQRELGNVDPDVQIAELVRHPAPLLHVHCEPAQARCLGSGGLLLAGLLVDLSRRDLGLCDGLPPLHGEVFLTQGLELRMLRVQ